MGVTLVISHWYRVDGYEARNLFVGKYRFIVLASRYTTGFLKLATSLWIVYVYEPLTVDHCEI